MEERLCFVIYYEENIFNVYNNYINVLIHSDNIIMWKSYVKNDLHYDRKLLSVIIAQYYYIIFYTLCMCTIA